MEDTAIRAAGTLEGVADAGSRSVTSRGAVSGALRGVEEVEEVAEVAEGEIVQTDQARVEGQMAALGVGGAPAEIAAIVAGAAVTQCENDERRVHTSQCPALPGACQFGGIECTPFGLLSLTTTLDHTFRPF